MTQGIFIDCSVSDEPVTRDHTTEEADALAAIHTIALAASIRADAQAALSRTDMVAIRCLKVAASFPEEWQDYVVALRAIVSSGEGPLPEMPAYPEGT